MPNSTLDNLCHPLWQPPQTTKVRFLPFALVVSTSCNVTRTIGLNSIMVIFVLFCALFLSAQPCWVVEPYALLCRCFLLGDSLNLSSLSSVADLQHLSDNMTCLYSQRLGWQYQAPHLSTIPFSPYWVTVSSTLLPNSSRTSHKFLQNFLMMTLLQRSVSLLYLSTTAKQVHKKVPSNILASAGADTFSK